MKRKIILLLTSIFALSISVAWSQTIVAPIKLLAADGEPGDRLGYSVAISGDTAVIGADGDADHGDWTGSAYVFVRQTDGSWSQQAKLVASDGAAADNFGKIVSISGDTALIGAFGDDDKGTNSGSAYVFVREADGTWKQQEKLLANDGTTGDAFGLSVAIFGDTAVIGAYADDDNGMTSGSAYVFVRRADDSWEQQAKLLADDGEEGEYFGRSVSVSGDKIMIGAWRDDDNGYRAGSVYYFVRQADDSWEQKDKLLADDGGAQDAFGYSVAISGNSAAIGAFGEDDNGANSGAAYVFDLKADDTWEQQDKLLATDGAAHDLFGRSVSIFYNTALIGAFGNDNNGENSGAAYVFSRQGDDSWVQKAKLLGANSAPGGEFGIYVAISNSTAVIGAFLNDDNGTDSGSAYVGFDSDGDTVTDISTTSQTADNCPTVWNQDQADINYDGFGDACVSPDSFIHQDATIGSFPIIGRKCIIDKGVTLGDFATLANRVSISRNVTAGSGLVVGKHTTIDQSTFLGKNVTLGSNTYIHRKVVIGNNVIIGDRTTVKQRVVIGNYVEGGTEVVIGRDATVSSGSGKDAPTIIPDYEFIPKETTYPPVTP